MGQRRSWLQTLYQLSRSQFSGGASQFSGGAHGGFWVRYMRHNILGGSNGIAAGTLVARSWPTRGLLIRPTCPPYMINPISPLGWGREGGRCECEWTRPCDAHRTGFRPLEVRCCCRSASGLRLEAARPMMMRGGVDRLTTRHSKPGLSDPRTPRVLSTVPRSRRRKERIKRGPAQWSWLHGTPVAPHLVRAAADIRWRFHCVRGWLACRVRPQEWYTTF